MKFPYKLSKERLSLLSEDDKRIHKYELYIYESKGLIDYKVLNKNSDFRNYIKDEVIPAVLNIDEKYIYKPVEGSNLLTFLLTVTEIPFIDIEKLFIYVNNDYMRCKLLPVDTLEYLQVYGPGMTLAEPEYVNGKLLEASIVICVDTDNINKISSIILHEIVHCLDLKNYNGHYNIDDITYVDNFYKGMLHNPVIVNRCNNINRKFDIIEDYFDLIMYMVYPLNISESHAFLESSKYEIDDYFEHNYSKIIKDKEYNIGNIINDIKLYIQNKEGTMSITCLYFNFFYILQKMKNLITPSQIDAFNIRYKNTIMTIYKNGNNIRTFNDIYHMFYKKLKKICTHIKQFIEDKIEFIKDGRNY